MVKLSNVLVAGLTVGVVMVLIYSVVLTMANNQHYDIAINSTYSERYDRIEEIVNTTDQIQKDIASNVTAEKDKGFFTGVWDFFTITKDAVLGTAKIGKGTLGFSYDMADQFADDIDMYEGSDSYMQESNTGSVIRGFLVALVTIIVIMVVIKMILPGDRV